METAVSKVPEHKKKLDGETPMNSKKFIAYLIAELSWKAIVVLLILSKDKLGDNLILLTIVLIAGFIEVAYILGQAYVDRYMRIADNAFDKLRGTVDAMIPDADNKKPDPVKESKPEDPKPEIKAEDPKPKDSKIVPSKSKKDATP